MQLTSKYNKGFLLLCVLDIFSKYAWVVPLKDKKGITSNNVIFQRNLGESNQKPNKIWLDKGSKFYKRSMKLRLQNNDLEICSRYNERESCVAKRFIRTLKNKIYKYLTSVSKGVY